MSQYCPGGFAGQPRDSGTGGTSCRERLLSRCALFPGPGPALNERFVRGAKRIQLSSPAPIRAFDHSPLWASDTQKRLCATQAEGGAAPARCPPQGGQAGSAAPRGPSGGSPHTLAATSRGHSRCPHQGVRVGGCSPWPGVLSPTLPLGHGTPGREGLDPPDLLAHSCSLPTSPRPFHRHFFQPLPRSEDTKGGDGTQPAQRCPLPPSHCLLPVSHFNADFDLSRVPGWQAGVCV